MNFVALVYIIDVKPFEKAELNFLNIINEIIGLFGSYIVLELQKSLYSPDELITIGSYAVFLFYLSAFVNLLTIALLASCSTYK